MTGTREGRALAMVALLACAACDGKTGDVLSFRRQAGQALLLLEGHQRPSGAAELSVLRSRIGAIEALPFDGIVIDLGFDRTLMQPTPLAAAGFDAAVDEVRRTSFRRFTDNFQSVHLAPVELDWFNDATFAVLAANVGSGASLVRQAGLRGFKVDNQVYGTKTWAFDAAAGRTFGETEQQVAKRGEAIMAAIIEAFPDAVVLLDFGSSEVLRAVCLEGAPLDSQLYALYPAFVDGMARAVAAAKSQALIVDVYLPAYPTVLPGSFATYYNLVHARWDELERTYQAGIVTHDNAAALGSRLHAWPSTAGQRCSPDVFAHLLRERQAGFGLMVDYSDPPAVFAFDSLNFSQNHFTPAALEASLTAALRATDRYVWLWSEAFDPVGLATPPGPAIPTDYLHAIGRARLSAGR